MAVFGTRTTSAFGRLVCTATLLFLFFLPLHVHLSLSPQLSSQCSCLQGARTQFVVAEHAPTVVPAPQFGVLLEPQVCVWKSTTSPCQHVRGPPLASAV
jgi:hypothetical protein